MSNFNNTETNSDLDFKNFRYGANCENSALAVALLRASDAKSKSHGSLSRLVEEPGQPQARPVMHQDISLNELQALLGSRNILSSQRSPTSSAGTKLTKENLHNVLASLLIKQKVLEAQQQVNADQVPQVASWNSASGVNDPLNQILDTATQHNTSQLQRYHFVPQPTFGTNVASIIADLQQQRAAPLLNEALASFQQQEAQPSPQKEATCALNKLLEMLRTNNTAQQDSSQPMQVDSRGPAEPWSQKQSGVCSTPAMMSGSQAQTNDSAATTAARRPAVIAAPQKKKRRGRSGSYPQKIHQMLRDLEEQGRSDIASFVQDGKAFCVHRPKEFASDVMPKYFKMGSYASFQRQLNLYNFTRISEGSNRGAYFHELFVQGKPLLSTTMKRKETKRPRQAS